MNGDLEQRLRERLHRAVLPSAPPSLRESLDAIVQTPPDRTVRRDRRRIVGLLAVAAVVATGSIALLTVGGRQPTETAIEPIASPSASSPLASASPSGGPSADTSPAPTPIASPSAPSAPTPVSPTTSPSNPGSPASANLQIHGAAREFGQRVLTAPGPGGTLFVWIPRPAGSVLALLEPSGQPRAGWPITIEIASWCGLLLPLEDGSVRLVCDNAAHHNLSGNIRAFAFDSAGRSMTGWPVQVRHAAARKLSSSTSALWSGRMIGDDLVVVAGDWSSPTAFEASVTTVAADGSVRAGTDVSTIDGGLVVGLAVAPDGIAFASGSTGSWGDGGLESSQVTALDVAGAGAHWPASFDGFTSGAAFGPSGQIVVTAGSFVRRTARIVTVDRDGGAVVARSAELPIATARMAAGCGDALPQAPIVADDGTVFVFSQIDPAVYALDPSLAIKAGWPYEPASPLVRPYYPNPQFQEMCTAFGVPAVGSDSTVYLPLQARESTVGGSIVAVGPDGRVRPGWPVELVRATAEFWSVVVGSDGTVYALAVEPETDAASSATVLAIAPDSTIRYATTIIEP